MMADAETQYNWNDIAIHPFALIGVGLGLLAAVIGGFLSTLYQVAEDPLRGIGQSSVWFVWIGFTLISVSLLLGGLFSNNARAGVRVAMVAIGLFLLVSTTNAPAVIAGFPF